MSEHRAALTWRQGNKGFEYKTFCRNHTIQFANGVEVKASSAPQFSGDATRVDPEELLVSALMSCHMLAFLSLCSRENLMVETYVDDAVGFLERSADRRLAVTRIELRPRVQFGPGVIVPEEKLADLHQRAHEACFVSNSIKTAVTVHPQATG